MGNLGVLGFAGHVYESFVRLDPLSQITTLLGLFGPVVGGTTWVVRRAMRRTSDELRIENQALSDLRDINERRIEALEQELAGLESVAPSSIIETMQRERRDDNEVLAIRALIRGFQSIAADIGQIAHELALHHLSTLPHMPRTGLAKAERFARIAQLCLPEDRDCQSLVAEIIEIKADRQEEHADAIENDDDEAVLEELFGLDVDVPTLVERLCESCNDNIVRGHYRTAERLARRAVITARGRLPPSSPVMLHARFMHAEALMFGGYYAEALAEVEALLPLEEKVRGAEHPNTLSTRHLWACILDHLGRYAEALDAVEALLPLEEKVRGAEHPATLISRFVSILIVHHLARQEEACEALRTLLPRMTASLPVNHQRLKQARELWAHCAGECQ